MGLKTPMALNLTLKEYEDRVEKFGRADGKSGSPKRETEAKGDKKTSHSREPQSIHDGAGFSIGAQGGDCSDGRLQGQEGDDGCADTNKPIDSSTISSADMWQRESTLSVVDITSDDELMLMKDGKSQGARRPKTLRWTRFGGD